MKLNLNQTSKSKGDLPRNEMLEDNWQKIITSQLDSEGQQQYSSCKNLEENWTILAAQQTQASHLTYYFF